MSSETEYKPLGLTFINDWDNVRKQIERALCGADGENLDWSIYPNPDYPSVIIHIWDEKKRLVWREEWEVQQEQRRQEREEQKNRTVKYWQDRVQNKT